MPYKSFLKALDGFRIRFQGWELEFDYHYGHAKGSTGWSVSKDGHYLVQLEPRFWKAVCKALKAARSLERRES